MMGKAQEGVGPNGEHTIEVQATNDVNYDYTFLDGDENKGCFDVGNLWLAEKMREYGRCVAVVDARVWEFYGSNMRAYFAHHELGLEVLPLGIDEEQKSLKTVEEAMVFFADVGVMRRETPLIIGGGLITDIVGTACSLYRRSTGYLRLPTTLIGMIDASVAIKVGGNLAEKHKNRIGAFHPHSGVVIDFSFLKTLPEAHVRNGVAELIKISTVEQRECFELLEEHCEDLIKYKFGYADNSPAGLRAVGRTIARKAVLRMLELEAPNLHEHDQHRAIAYGHTWSPAYELTSEPLPMHHGHAISTDMCFSATWAAQEGWISEDVRDRVHNIFAKCGLTRFHPCFTAAKLHYGTKAILQRRDGDLYAALPNNKIGECKYIKVGDFESRAAMDASLEKALGAHAALMKARFEDEGLGKECYITEGLARAGHKCSKLELGTWAERLEEMVEDVQDSQSFETVRDKVQKIGEWWECSQKYLERHSTTIGAAVQDVLKATKAQNPFPAGMDMNWALDVQSAQTLDFLAGLKKGAVALDLGTLTGVSAAVLSQHFEKVVSCEREQCLVEFAQKHLPGNVEVVQAEIVAFLESRIGQEPADLIFMDLDKTCYPTVYELVRKHKLLKTNGLLLADNVLYRGLPAQLEAGTAPTVSAKTQANAEALLQFNDMVKADMESGAARALMMPVRDGMLALTLEAQ